MKKELVDIPRTTLDIYKYEKDDFIYYEFDATECSPPEPMVNAVICLNHLKDENERIVGIFFHEPIPLYERISGKFEYEATELDSGDFKIVFKRVEAI